MIQELFLLSLDACGEGFERAVVRAILEKGAMAPIGNGALAYPDGSRAIVFNLDGDRPRAGHLLISELHGCTVLRRIFEVADRLDIILFWPEVRVGAPNACVTRAERLTRIGPALRSSLTVAVIGNIDQLCALVGRASAL